MLKIPVVQDKVVIQQELPSFQRTFLYIVANEPDEHVWRDKPAANTVLHVLVWLTVQIVYSCQGSIHLPINKLLNLKYFLLFEQDPKQRSIYHFKNCHTRFRNNLFCCKIYLWSCVSMKVSYKHHEVIPLVLESHAAAHGSEVVTNVKSSCRLQSCHNSPRPYFALLLVGIASIIIDILRT